MAFREMVVLRRKIRGRDARFRWFRRIAGAAIALILVSRLWSLLQSWILQPDSIELRLSALVTAVSLAVVAHSALSTLKGAFSANAIHRLSLPLSSAWLLRMALVEHSTDLMATGGLVGLSALGSILLLGPMAAAWWMIVVAGAPFCVWLGFMVSLVFVRRPWIPLSLVFLATAIWWVVGLPGLGWWRQVSSTLWGVLAPLCAAALASFVVVGPLAGWGGRLYRAVLEDAQKKTSRSSISRRLVGLAEPLRNWSSPTGALLRRGVLLETRSSFAWLRILGATITFSVVPIVVDPATIARFSKPWSAGFLATAVVWLFFIVDGATSPMGAEGTRLQLFLTSPLPSAALVRAKLAVFLVAAGFTTLGGLLLTGLFWPPGFVFWPESLATVVSLMAGLAPIYVLGSCFDADANRPLPSGLEGRLFEEAPITGIRMLLVSAGAAYLSASFLALGEFSFGTATALIILGDAGLTLALWRLALGKMKRWTLAS